MVLALVIWAIWCYPFLAFALASEEDQHFNCMQSPFVSLSGDSGMFLNAVWGLEVGGGPFQTAFCLLKVQFADSQNIAGAIGTEPANISRLGVLQHEF